MALVPGKKRAAGVDNTARRTWDKEEYAEKAAEREKKAVGEDGEEITALELKKRKRLERDPLHQGLIVERSNLKTRDYQIDLTSRLNKTQVGAGGCAVPVVGGRGLEGLHGLRCSLAAGRPPHRQRPPHARPACHPQPATCLVGCCRSLA
jgi:hypothetical protein